MIISTQITNNELVNGTNGLELSSITVVVNFQSDNNYFGGQVVLTKLDDEISLQSTTDEIQNKAIAKAKKMIDESTLPVIENQGA